MRVTTRRLGRGGGTMSDEARSSLRRPLNPMTDDVRLRLEGDGLMQAYLARPAYQRNDYLGWIDRAKGDGVRERRIAQMLSELETGGVYMKMAWHPKASS
jgi:hypothetical protein